MTKHLYPLPDVFIPGVEHVEQDVDEATAKELLAYSPPAFSLKPPTAPKPAAEPAAPDVEGA